MTLVMTRHVASGFNIWLGRGARSGKNFSSRGPVPSTLIFAFEEVGLAAAAVDRVRPRRSMTGSSEWVVVGDDDVAPRDCSVLASVVG